MLATLLPIVFRGDGRLSSRAQAMTRKGRRCLAWPVAAACAAGLIVSGCSGGALLKRAEADPTILTGSVPGQAAPVDRELASDQVTIKNLVAGIDPEGLADSGLAWTNTTTGSRGTVTEVAEFRDRNELCRRFMASRERFDGVSLYTGETCLGAAGIWQMRRFGSE
jgi:hypothetical protein